MESDYRRSQTHRSTQGVDFRPIFQNDRRVAKAIYEGEELDSLYVLGSDGLLDGILVLMRDIGYMDFLKRFNVIEDYKRMILPLFHFIVTYMARIIMGIPSMNALPQLLFHNTATMELLGFNAEVLKNGICNRGADRRSPDKEPPAPFTPQTLSNVLGRFSPEESCLLLDSLIQCLAARRFFDEEVSVIIDATDIEVPRSFKDMDKCGVVTRKKKVRDKNGKITFIYPNHFFLA